MIFGDFFFQKKWSIRSALFWAEKVLKNFQSSRLESEVLLAAVLEVDRVFLKKNVDDFLSVAQQKKFRKFIRRRAHGEPVAYILGEKNWANLSLGVSPAGLIPRDETEVLAETIWKSPRSFSPEKILDVGTGSGNLAIFLAKKFPDAFVTALDFSPAALQIAKKNAERNSVCVNFLVSDFLQKIDDGDFFDLIVANLPYVPTKISISREVRREPKTAIFSGSDGLDHLRKFRSKLSRVQFRELWLEFLPTQVSEIKKIFAPSKIDFFPDASGQIFFARITP